MEVFTFLFFIHSQGINAHVHAWVPVCVQACTYTLTAMIQTYTQRHTVRESTMLLKHDITEAQHERFTHIKNQNKLL